MLTQHNHHNTSPAELSFFLHLVSWQKQQGANTNKRYVLKQAEARSLLRGSRRTEENKPREERAERWRRRVQARSRFCCCHRNSLVGVIRGAQGGWWWWDATGADAEWEQRKGDGSERQWYTPSSCKVWTSVLSWCIMTYCALVRDLCSQFNLS